MRIRASPLMVAVALGLLNPSVLESEVAPAGDGGNVPAGHDSHANLLGPAPADEEDSEGD